MRANLGGQNDAPTSMQDVDKVLHAERAIAGGANGTFDAVLGELPIGVMFEHAHAAYLVSSRGFLPWSFSGYGEETDIDADTVVKVLTPRSVVQAFAHGFVPTFHGSAHA